MTVTVRFAPSPTGYIHIGNARTALFNWLFALNNKGRFIQRFDDTDQVRSTQAFADAILYDLHWLGIFPDRTEYQSRRTDAYEAVVEKLKAAGQLYPCYETAQELDVRRKIRLSRKLPPIYGREALKLTAEQKAAFDMEGRKPHWRFRLPNFAANPGKPVRTEIVWSDLIRGEETVDLASVSDPVLVREDGTFLYTLPSVVDDIDFGVTHVIRGDDHVTNTGVQIALFRALGAEPPVFGHHNLLTTTTGEGLSKRTGALSIRGLREDGIEPMAVASLAVLTGTSENVAVGSMQDLASRFDPANTSKSAAKFDPADLKTLNHAVLKSTPYDDVRDRLSVMGIVGDRAEQFWIAVRGNIERLGEAGRWWDILGNGPEAHEELGAEDRAILETAFSVLPEEPWDRSTWRRWLAAARDATGLNGKQVAMPIRLAVTGLRHGPELSDLLMLLGREGTLARRP